MIQKYPFLKNFFRPIFAYKQVLAKKKFHKKLCENFQFQVQIFPVFKCLILTTWRSSSRINIGLYVVEPGESEFHKIEPIRLSLN